MNKNRLYKRAWELVKDRLLEYSLPEVKRNITNCGVLINGKLEFNQLAWIYDNDELDIAHWPRRQSSDFSDLVVLFQNDDFIIINKPVGVVVEPGTGHNHDNLISYFQKEMEQTVFTVHRLDKDTSGLMLLAKNQDARDRLQDLFRARRVTKKYLAVAKGQVDSVFDIVNWQTRDKENPLRQKFFWTEEEARDYDKDAKKAVSIIKPLVFSPQSNQSLIEVSIHTGRMHQIRLQCQALGFSLHSDPIYGDFAPIAYNPPSSSKFTIIAKRNKYGYEYFKQSLEIQGQKEDLNNPNLATFLPFEPVTELQAKDFAILKRDLFGQREYCLMSNSLSFTYEGRVITSQLFFVEDVLNNIQNT